MAQIHRSGNTMLPKRKAALTFILITLLLAGYTNAQDEDFGAEICSEASVSSCGLSAEEIMDYPGSGVTPLAVAGDLLHDRRYQQVTGEVEIYDAPNGTPVRTLDAGFNFLTILDVQTNGWTQINHGEWVRSTSLVDTNHIVSRFTGVFLPEESPTYPIAWMLINAYPAQYPGGEPNESNRLIFRYTMVNIFDEVVINNWRWYQVGPMEWIHQTSVAKIIPTTRPENISTEKWIGIDLYEQTLIAYEGEKPVFSTLISSGLPRWPTYEGLFHIYYRRVRHDMSWGTPGDDFYYLEEVPWTMFFDEGRALHGVYWHDGLGYRRSHGCVNMSISDANWLYEWVAEEFDRFNSPDVEEGPNVYIYTSGQYR